MKFKTEQEGFWAGEFGTEYTKRNGSLEISERISVFAEVLKHTKGAASFLELGANVGYNELAIKALKPEAQLTAVEINESAYQRLSKIDGVESVCGSILEFEPGRQWDFVFTSGVLIHICPEELEAVYEKMYRFSKKYIYIKEYYNPTPVEVEYRGHLGRMFKRDFAGEMLDKYKDLKLEAYGFSYHRDNNFPGGDSNWFLLSKSTTN